jgi:hypothetical protein
MHGTLEELRDHYPGKWLLIELDDSEAEEGKVLVAHEDHETVDKEMERVSRLKMIRRKPLYVTASNCSLAGLTFAGPARKKDSVDRQRNPRYFDYRATPGCADRYRGQVLYGSRAGNDRLSICLLDQVRAIGAERVHGYRGTLDAEQYRPIHDGLRGWRRRPRADHGVGRLIEVMVRERRRPARAFGQVRRALDSYRRGGE